MRSSYIRTEALSFIIYVGLGWAFSRFISGYARAPTLRPWIEIFTAVRGGLVRVNAFR